MKTFGKLSKNNNSYNSKIINSFPKYKDKIVKIQSIWRGAYVREIMTFYLNINKFKIIIDKVINMVAQVIYLIQILIILILIIVYMNQIICLELKQGSINHERKKA